MSGRKPENGDQVFTNCHNFSQLIDHKAYRAHKIPLYFQHQKFNKKLTLIYFPHFQIGSLKNYYLFHHRHVQKRSLSSNDTHHAVLNKEPEVDQSSRPLVMKQLNEPDNDMIFIFMALLEFHGSPARLNEKLHRLIWTREHREASEDFSPP